MAIFQDLRPKIEADKKWEKAMLQLMQSERLASLGRLAAGVAHEINNPLSGIIMYNHLVLEELPKESLAYENLMKAVTQAERCKNIVRALLDLSRQHEPEFESVHVNDVIEEVLSLIEMQTIFQNIEIVRKLSTDLPSIRGDRSQLQQVFMNLAINAAEAMERGGKLTIETAFKWEIAITFTDTGPGIPLENRDKIFEPFFTTRSDKGGNGLGLAVSHGIITGHGGTIGFASKVNEGTTFTVRLPLNTT
jgi:signal transduction histidine kinase